VSARTAAVAALGAAMLAWPGQAAAGDGLLAGKPRVGTVRAMVPERGRDAGRLVVWVRVDHAAGSRRAVLRERPETIQTVRVAARVGGARRLATRRLDLGRARLQGGYFLRFSKSDARATGAGIARRARVALRVSQALDVDADGDAEERAAIASARSVALATPATTIEPKDGQYQSTAGDVIDVLQGHVTGFFFITGTDSPCGVGPADQTYAPIDPQTGIFGVTSKNEGYGPTTVTEVSGYFKDDQDAVVAATITNLGDNCQYSITNHDFALFQWPPAE
jgi:hypothetical protein